VRIDVTVGHVPDRRKNGRAPHAGRRSSTAGRLAGTGPASAGNASGLFVIAVGTNRVVYVAEHLAGKALTWRPISGKTTADPGIATPSPNTGGGVRPRHRQRALV